MSKKLYHKIHAPFKRDMSKKDKPLILNDWTCLEFEILKDIEWTAYEKIDGTNIRIHFDGNEVVVGGRTEAALIPNHLLGILKDTFTVDKLKEIFPDLNEDTELTIYGEGYGYKIQKGDKYFSNPKEVGFILFDINVSGWWLKYEDLLDISEKLGVKIVPKVAEGTLSELMELVSNGLKSKFGDFYAEGVVAKPVCELFKRNRERILTKIKHVDFFKGEK